MAHDLIVVGIGPGHPDYVLPAARKLIDAAKTIAGGARALRDFASVNQCRIKVDGDISRLIGELKTYLEKTDVVVMVSGDPGYFSLLEVLRREFPSKRIRVIPGVSSFQVAFAQIGLSWQNAKLVSAHGRKPDMADLVYERGRPLSFLTDSKHHPAQIAAWLMEQGWPEESLVWLCRNLSYHDEVILKTSLAEALEVNGFDSCVMVVMQ